MNEKCYLCGTELVEKNKSREHVIPNAIGGTLKPNNIICDGCNKALGNEIDVPFNKLFESITTRLHIKVDNPAVKSTKALTGFLGDLEISWDNFKVTPRNPFYEYDDKSGHLTVFAHPKSISDYAKKAEKDMSDKAVLETILVTDMSQCGEVSFPFELDNRVFKRGLAKIAAGFAAHHNIQREQLPLVIDLEKEKILDDIFVVPFFPTSPIERFVEISRINIDPEFPHHNLLLFTERFGDESGVTKKLICYIELFGTFQHYILLNDDFKGDDVFEWYGQKIFKEADFKISGWIDPKTMHIYLRELGLSHDDLNEFLEKKFVEYRAQILNGSIATENQVEESVFRETMAKEFVEIRKNQSKFQFDYRDHIDSMLSNLFHIMQMENDGVSQHLDEETSALAKVFNEYFLKNSARMVFLLLNVDLYYSQTDSGDKEFTPNAYRRRFVDEKGQVQSQFSLSIERAIQNKGEVNSYGHMKFYELMKSIEQIEANKSANEF